MRENLLYKMKQSAHATVKQSTVLVSGLCGIFFSSIIWADTGTHAVVDIYKTNQISVQEVNKKFGKQLQEIAEIMESPDSTTSEKNQAKLSELARGVKSGIEKSGDFSYVNISPILYPKEKDLYITIDLIDKNDKKRMFYFSKKPTGSIPDPDHLIQSWQEYEKTGTAIFLKEKVPPTFKVCPAHHCIYGFDHPALKKYQAIFSNGAEKNKKQLVAILRKDKDERKRQAAVYLLAHIKDGNELIRLLIPAIHDSDSVVRNNAMRVLAEDLRGLKNPDFPVDQAIVALDFPYTTDRNKALYILFSLVLQPRYAHYITLHAHTELMDELRMSQPNVHGLAYYILKIASGKNYGERDYASWEKWLKSNGSHSI